MEFYAAMKNEILSFSGKWMELENIILSKVSLAQKTKNHTYILPHMWILDQGQIQQGDWNSITWKIESTQRRYEDM
jgi:hypothetical protein